MNTERKIKRDWGSVSIVQDGSVLVAVVYDNKPCCLYFETAEQLKEAIQTRQLMVKKWAVCVPRNLCILKRLNLPARDMDEAIKMTEFELPSLVPIPHDKIIYGCTLLANHANILEILVTILKADVLNSYLRSYELIGIKPTKVVLSSLAVQRWFSASVDGIGDDIRISVLVENESCVIHCSLDGNLHMVRTLNSLNKSKGIDVREIVKEILHCKKKLSVVSDKKVVVLVGGLRDFAVQIADRLAVGTDELLAKNVKVVATSRIIAYQGSDISEDFKDDSIMVTGLLMLVTNSELSHFNLIPRDQLKKYARKALLVKCISTGILCFLFILSVWLCLWGLKWRVDRKCKMIRLQIAPVEQIAGSVEKKRKQVGVIRSQLANRGQICQLIEELYRYTPRNISISELNFVAAHDGGVLGIKGQSDVLSNAFSYTEAMKQGGLLNNLQMENAQQVSKLGGSIVEFRANCEVKKAYK